MKLTPLSNAEIQKTVGYALYAPAYQTSRCAAQSVLTDRCSVWPATCVARSALT